MSAQEPLFSRRLGGGARAALAVHCTLGHSGAWRSLAQVLADDLTLTAFDLPSHGRSPDWDGVTPLHEVCGEGALSVINQPVDLIGHSFGAVIALMVAVQRPDLVRSLTLIEPVFFAAAGAYAPEKLAAYEAQAADYTTLLAQEDWPAAARAFNRVWGDGTPWDSLPSSAQAYMTDRMHIVRAQEPLIFNDAPDLLGPGRLEQVDMPCLLLQGAQSPAIIDVVHEALAARLPSCTRKTLEDVGHMAPITHAGEVARAIRSLLEVA